MRTISKVSYILIGANLLTSACGGVSSGNANQTNANTAQTNAAAPVREKSPYEKDLDYVRNGRFRYIYVFTRKDNAEFTPDDIVYLKKNSPAETNQWTRAEANKRIIAGSNFYFAKEHYAVLLKRFNIEDFSNTEEGATGTPLTAAPADAKTLKQIDDEFGGGLDPTINR